MMAWLQAQNAKQELTTTKMQQKRLGINLNEQQGNDVIPEPTKTTPPVQKPTSVQDRSGFSATAIPQMPESLKKLRASDWDDKKAMDEYEKSKTGKEEAYLEAEADRDRAKRMDVILPSGYRPFNPAGPSFEPSGRPQPAPQPKR